ncbi:LuxR C-terminal-related transcriptional regulator [Microbacterium sp. JZ31]|uniref:LuxR C-terminal-related transcriptional regulator n=1 Tax=Microbacterium sp. JZ31 TaxID=1906274 RepID=UPI001932CFD2|nr:LuxR C-terminal-related transcriptional regulator [Microbacterium sp. JZ31]
MSSRISIPRPPHAHIPRPRLVQRLEDATGPAVRIVQSPAGYGKTQLLAEWARSRPHDEAVVWIGVDASAPDDAFWTTLAERLARVDPEPSDAAESAEDPRARAIRHVAELRTPVTVVVDGFDDLRPPSAEELFRWTSATDHVSLLLAVRSHPPRALTSRVGAASVLSAADLAFDAEETARLAAALGASITDATAATLTDEAEGWALAIRIALQHAADGTVRPWRERGETVAEAQRALLAPLEDHPGFAALRLASAGETVSPALASALGLPPEHVDVLDEACRRGLGWWEEDHGERSFRLHPVIRPALQQRLSPEERRHAFGLIAEWMSERERFGEAFAAAVDGERWDLARSLAYTAFPEITTHLGSSPDTLPKVPTTVTRSDPMLGFLSALSHYTRGRTAQAVKALGSAFATTQRRRLLTPGKVTPERVWTQGLLTAGLRLSGRYEFVEPALRRFESMLEAAQDPEGLLAPAAGLFANEVAVTELYLGKLDEARDALARAPRRPHRTKKQHFYADALDAQILTLQGRFVDARRAVDKLRAAGLPAGFDESFYGIPLMLATAALHREHGALDEAAAALHRTEAHWSTTENWPLLLAAHAETAWHRDDALSALEMFELRRAEQHRRAHISPALSDLLRATQAQLLLAAGRIPEARQLIGSHGHRPSLAAVRAQILLAEGRLSDASEAADTALRMPGTTPLMRVDLLLVTAGAALRAGDTHAAARPFRLAAELGARHGMRTPFARLGAEERRLLLDEVGADAACRDAVLARPPLFPESAVVPRLTKRELATLHDVGRGLTLTASAERHRLSVNTIKAQRRSLYRKLGVSTASQAVSRARELGLL